MDSRKSGLIAIAGRPNAGKSTLLNRILGSAVSIVTPKAQTTRERVLGILTEPQGQIVFVDTPGIHSAKKGGFNEFMVSEAAEALDGPNLIWYLVDPDSAMDHEKTVIELLGARADRDTPVWILMNKSDLNRNTEDLGLEIQVRLRELSFRDVQLRKVSGRKGQGVDDLVSAAWSSLPEGPFLFPDEEQLSDRPVRFFVGEKIREQLFLKLGDELPYSCAVEIVQYRENVVPPRIEAVIHVERDSQKGMVIGAGGKKIKEIGSAARQEIEAFVGGPVFLGLQVKVLPHWTRDAENLKRLGYLLPSTKSSQKGSQKGKRES
ncbi:MAG: GTPase [Pseudomonadota bacterium]|jgi:GTP-binding protein Era